ncbi:MAG: D-alanine--D-alanine ligase family protein [Elusimicrobiales bacterium]
MKLKIAVFYGGKSAEHEVSVHSAETVGSLLSPEKYQVFPVYITRGGKWLLEKACGRTDDPAPEVSPVLHGGFHLNTGGGPLALDAAFPVIHGPLGEDGTLQGLFEQMELPYVGCGVTASAIGMDKDISKRLAALAGLPVLEHALVSKPDCDFVALEKKAAQMGWPVFVKPAALGSSVGVTRADSPEKLRQAVEYGFKFDTRVMVEKAVENAREIVCGVLGEGASVKASACGEVKPSHEFYDYNAKYIDPDGMKLSIPAQLSGETASAIRAQSVDFFRAIGGSGLARIDFLLDGAGKHYFCEINTLPGFTSHSLYPRLWQAAGVEPPALVDELVSLALARAKERGSLLLKPDHAVC